MEKQRDKSLDIICGLLIIHMISGHIFLFANLDNSLFFRVENFILFFFMPWFFFKGGMFFKRNSDYKTFARKSFSRLMIPFITWGIVGSLFWLVWVATSENRAVLVWYLASLKTLPIEGRFLGNGPLWFLLSLFIVRIGYNLFYCNKFLLWSLVGLSAVIPFLCNVIDFNSWLLISHTLLGFFFFHWGYIMRDKQYKIKVFITAIIDYLIMMVFCPTMVGMYQNGLDFGSNYLLYFPYALLAIVFFNNLFKYITPPHTLHI